MTNSEKAVTWGLLAFIAWELWKPSGLQAPGPGCGPATSPSSGIVVPPWVKQLSGDLMQQDVFTPTCGIFGRCS
jgi:hypothetical protein